MNFILKRACSDVSSVVIGRACAHLDWASFSNRWSPINTSESLSGQQNKRRPKRDPWAQTLQVERRRWLQRLTPGRPCRRSESHRTLAWLDVQRVWDEEGSSLFRVTRGQHLVSEFQTSPSLHRLTPPWKKLHDKPTVFQVFFNHSSRLRAGGGGALDTRHRERWVLFTVLIEITSVRVKSEVTNRRLSGLLFSAAALLMLQFYEDTSRSPNRKTFAALQTKLWSFLSETFTAVVRAVLQ